MISKLCRLVSFSNFYCSIFVIVEVLPEFILLLIVPFPDLDAVHVGGDPEVNALQHEPGPVAVQLLAQHPQQLRGNRPKLNPLSPSSFCVPIRVGANILVL